MIYLILCIISASGIMVVFKIAGNQKLNTFRIIVINYITASILGFGLSDIPSGGVIDFQWIPMAIIIGILFIIMFFVIALSTQKAGIAVTSVATKMSVVIPISFSIIYFNEEVNILKISGIILAVIAVFMTSYNKDKAKSRGWIIIALPVIIFIGSGIIDSLIKYTQELRLNDQGTVLFSSVLFLVSAITGIIIGLFRKDLFSRHMLGKTLIAGISLGIVNFGSLYGIIMALESNIFDSSIVFGINNMGIVVLSVLIAMVFFDEKLSKLNMAGIFLSILTVTFLSFL